MKKYSWILALLVALAMVFVGCGNGNGDDPDEIEYDVTLINVTQTDINDDIDDVPEDERASGKGFIIGEDFDLIKEAPPGSFLRLTVTGSTNLDWDSIGAVGINDMAGSSGNRVDFAAKSGGTYTIDVPVANIFALVGGATAEVIHVNIWGGHVIDKVELYTPIGEVFIPVTSIKGIPEYVYSSPFTLEGVVDPPDANNTTIVWSLKTGTTATINGAVLTFTGPGSITVTATIADGKAEGEAYTEDFDIYFVNLPMFSNAEFVGRYTAGNAIGFDGVDGDLDWELFTDSTFIVLAFMGSPTNRSEADGGGINLDGFGGLQFVTQYEGDSWGWNQLNVGSWTGRGSLDLAEDKVVYFVFPMASLPKYSEIAASDDGAKIVLNHGFNRYLGAWFTDASLVIGSGVAHGDGWFTFTTGLAE